jgi:hypothetical protein
VRRGREGERREDRRPVAVTFTHVALTPLGYFIPERFYTGAADDALVVLLEEHITAKGEQSGRGNREQGTTQRAEEVW